MVSILFNSPFVISIAWIFGLFGVFANMYIFKTVLPQVKAFHKIRSASIGQQSSLRRLTQPYSNNKSNRFIGKPAFLILIINLAVSDLMGALYLLIIACADLRFRFITVNFNTTSHLNSSAIYLDWIGSPFCFIARFCNLLSTFQSAFIILLIAIDRYISVTYPLSVKVRITPKFATQLLILGWGLGLSMACIFSVFASITFPPRRSISYQFHNLCSVDDLAVYYVRFALMLCSFTGIVTYFLILSLYFATYYKLRKFIHKNKTDKRSSKKTEWKTLKIGIAIVISNFLAWFPSIICAIAININFKLLLDNIDFLNVLPKILVLFQVNCSINPIICFTMISTLHISQVMCRHESNCFNV